MSSSKGVYDLGLILEKGSRGGQVVRPVSRKALKFNSYLRKSIVRGSIPATHFVRRTKDAVEPELLKQTVLTFKKLYESYTP